MNDKIKINCNVLIVCISNFIGPFDNLSVSQMSLVFRTKCANNTRLRVNEKQLVTYYSQVHKP